MLFLPDDGRGEAQNTPGKFVEMGIALAMGKPIVRVKGGDRSVFDAASGVQEVSGIDEALTKLEPSRRELSGTRNATFAGTPASSLRSWSSAHTRGRYSSRPGESSPWPWHT